jgi:hypothetical protein
MRGLPLLLLLLLLAMGSAVAGAAALVGLEFSLKRAASQQKGRLASVLAVMPAASAPCRHKSAHESVVKKNELRAVGRKAAKKGS